MADSRFASLFSQKVKIGKREIPVAFIGGGIGVTAAVFVLLRRKGGGVSAAPAPAATGTTPTTDQAGSLAEFSAQFQKALAEQAATSQAGIAGVQKTVAEQQAEYLNQIAGLQGNLESRAAGLQSQFQQQIGSVQTDVTQLQNSFNAYKTDVTTSQTAQDQKIAALNERVAGVEGQQTTIKNILGNQLKWFQLNNLGITQAAFAGNPQAQQQASADYSTWVYGAGIRAGIVPLGTGWK